MSANPGSLAAQAPQYPATFRSRKARDAERAAMEQASARTLQAAQFGVGGILINGGGSLTIADGGSLNVGTGALNSAGSITAGTTITAGGNITSTGGAVIAAGNVQGGGVVSTGAMSVAGSGTFGGNVSVSGALTSAGALVSPGSRATIVTVGFVNAYLDGSGVLGFQPSTRRMKKDLEPITDEVAGSLLGLTPYLGRYNWDEPDAPLRLFLIAEDVHDAGFGPDVVPLDEDGNPATVNSQNLIPALLALIQRQDARITALESARAGN